MLIRYVRLWPLTCWPWIYVVHQVSRDQFYTKFKQNRAITGWVIDNFSNFWHPLCHHVTLSFDPLTLTSVVICLNTVHNLSEPINPRLSYWRFITFLRSNFRGWRIFSGLFSGMRGPNFTNLANDIARSSMLTNLFQSSDVLLHFQTLVN